MRFLIVTLLLFLALTMQDSYAKEEAKAVKLPSESLVKPMLNTYVVNEMIDIRPIDNHHFNLKADNNCNKTAPQTMKKDFMQCQFEEKGNYTINVYICDKEETFCKIEKVKIKVTAPRGYKKALKKKVSSNILYVPKASLKAPPGFIKNREQYAIEKAKKENKPLLIVFSAQWCPACNMLDENVFQSKSFQKDTKDLVKLIMDVDSDISWKLKEKFKVGAYPTTILTTSTLNEIGRFIGYKTPTVVSAWVKKQVAMKNNPMDLIISKVQKGVAVTNDILRLAEWQLDRNEPESAKLTLLKQNSPQAKKLTLIADYQIYESKNQKKEAAEALATLIDQNPKDIYVSVWAKNLGHVNPEILKERMAKVAENVSSFMKDKDIESREFTKAELYYNLAESYESLGNHKEALRNFKNCANEYQLLSKESSLKIPRGAQMEKGFCLVKAGMSKEALEIFKNLAKAYSAEFAFNYYYAKALFDTGKFSDAYKYVKRAYDGSYGDNMIRAATLKAQIEINQRKLKEAEKTVSRTLKKVYLPETTQIRSHRYVANLKGVLAKIQIQKEALSLKNEQAIKGQVKKDAESKGDLKY